MTYDSLSLSEVIPARPERIYAAWLSSDEHSAFTGDKAVIEPFVGGKHSTFDGYSVGQTLALQPGHRIVQTWRAEDFPLGSPDSRVEVTLEETVGGTMVTILHTEIPSGQGGSYRDAWVQYYLEPLKAYFVAVRPRSNGVPTQPPRAPAVKVKQSKTKAKTTPKGKKKTSVKKTKRTKKAAPSASRRVPSSKAKQAKAKKSSAPAKETTKKPNKKPNKKPKSPKPSRRR